MNWQQLQSLEQLAEITAASENHPIVIFKHSTRCSISSMALNRLERGWDSAVMNDQHAYYLDLIRHRDISNAIAHQFDIPHESPQLLVIYKGQVLEDTSHMGISFEIIKEALGSTAA